MTVIATAMILPLDYSRPDSVGVVSRWKRSFLRFLDNLAQRP